MLVTLRNTWDRRASVYTGVSSKSMAFVHSTSMSLINASWKEIFKKTPPPSNYWLSNSQHFKKMTGTVLSALQALLPSAPETNLCEMYCGSHFKDEETEVQ